MEKINNIKEKFYLLKKHMREEDCQNLIYYPNHSMVNYLKNKINIQNINIKEKSKDTLFTKLINHNQKKNNSKILEKKNKTKEKEKEKYQTLINQENNNLIKTNKLLEKNSKQNILNIEEVNEKENNNMSINSSSSSSISNFNLKSEEEKKEIIHEKDNLYDNDDNNGNIFDETYILDCKSDLSNNINNNYSFNDNEDINNNDNINNNIDNNNININNINNNNEIIIDTNIKSPKINQKLNNNLSVKNNKNESKININKKILKNKEKNNNLHSKSNLFKEQKENKKLINERNQVKGDKKIIKKSLTTQPINPQNNFPNKKNIYQENNKTNETINNNNNITSNKITNNNNNNKQIIVNQTNIIVTNTKIKIPYILEDIDTCGNNYSNILENKIVEDFININNNMNINTNNINNERKQNNQNSNFINDKNELISKIHSDVNKKEFSKTIPVNNKIIIDDEEEIHNKKDNDNINKSKDKNYEKKTNNKKNSLVSLEGTQVKLRFEDNQITPIKDNNSFISENSNLNKINNYNEKINHNIQNKKVINQKIISHENKNIIKPKNNHIHSHSHSNNHINNSIKSINQNNNSKNSFSEDKFTKKEISSFLLSQFSLILKTMEENFRKEYQDDYNNSLICKTIEDSLNHISELENLDIITKRRKSVCKQMPKLISTLFRNFEEEKRRDVILNNVNSLLESITFYFHEMKIIYLKKERKVPPKFLQLKTIIKYIYSLFKLKSFSTKYLKDYIKNKSFLKINNFTKYYKTYQNSTEKLLHFLKKINEEHKAIKKYNNLIFYLEMNPLMIKYSKCYKQGRKMIDFFFDYFEYNSNSSEKKNK